MTKALQTGDVYDGLRQRTNLVEVMEGMQTVKAQNLEMRSRWQWQE
jgi:ABC-type bacteriocin/lantibiotic exporter with double-glycine peptidase domain